MSEERQMVLRMLKEGKITLDEADALLEALEEEGSPPSGEAAPGEPAQPVDAAREARARVTAEGLNSLGTEIREVVRKALEHARPLRQAAVGESLREVGRTLREELRGVSAEVDVSLGGMVRDLFGLSSASNEFSLSHDVAPAGRLVLRNRRGDVTIGRSPDGVLRVTGRKQCWWRTPEAAEGLLHHVQVTLTPRGSDLVLEVGLEPEAPPRLRYRVDLAVQVPEGIAVDLDVKSGDVGVAELTADLAARIASGDLSVAAHAGNVRAEVMSGDVDVAEAHALELHVLSGDVQARQVRGAAQIRVKSGDVEVGEAHDDVEVDTKSGDVTLKVDGSSHVRARAVSGDLDVILAALAPGARVSLETVAGDVSVTVTPEIRAGVRAQATAGGINMESVPLTDLKKGRGWVEGVLGSGEGSIELRAISGDLTVRVAEGGERGS